MLDRVEEAIRAFEALDRDPYAVDSMALSAYINALARAGRMEAALRVLLRSDEAAAQAGASCSVRRMVAILKHPPMQLLHLGHMITPRWGLCRT